MNDNLFFIREAQSVLADKSDSKGLTVHGFFSTWPVYKFIFCLLEQQEKFSALLSHLILKVIEKLLLILVISPHF